MYIFTSAVKNIRRYAGRYCFTGILLAIVLGVGAIANLAQISIGQEMELLKMRYGATLVVEGKFETLSQKDFTPITKLPQVKRTRTIRFYMSFYQDALMVDGQAIDPEYLSGAAAYQRLAGVKAVGLWNNNETLPTLNLCGIDFQEDATLNQDTLPALLAAGRMPQKNDELLLDSRFGETLGFPEVGLDSKITLTIGSVEREFTVVGIFTDIDKTLSRTYKGDETSYVPFITTLSGAEAFNKEGNLDSYYGALVPQRSGYPNVGAPASAFSFYERYVYLKSYTQYSAFCRLVSELRTESGQPYTVEFVYPGAGTLLKTYENTDKICTFFLSAVIAISAAVILIMTALAMHERRYEIGVLLSVGMGKWRIALLFAVENLFFTFCVAVLAYAAGLAAAPAVAVKLLTGVVKINLAAAAGPTAWRMLVLAVGLSLPASLISSLAILRYRPMAILRSRS